jgi:hypothetical protein
MIGEQAEALDAEVVVVEGSEGQGAEAADLAEAGELREWFHGGIILIERGFLDKGGSARIFD